MRQIILFSLIFFIIPSKNRINAQIIWKEEFTIPEKGYWIGESENLVSDLSDVEWSVDVSTAQFSATGDWAKTVSTSGGRFEVLDSDGEVVWYSPAFDISGFSVVNVSLKASEIGTNTSADKKYIKARYRLDGTTFSFLPDSVASGNWGNKTLAAQGIVGNLLQLEIVMNSSYSSDRVVIDDVLVEGIDSTLFEPQRISFLNVPSFAFLNEETTILASVLNRRGEMITDKEFDLSFHSLDLQLAGNRFENGIYYWSVTPDSTGMAHLTIQFENTLVASIDTFLQVYFRGNVILSNDFESANDSTWQTSGHWSVSSENPISGSSSLKHLVQPENGISSAYSDIAKRNMGDGDYHFSFKLKNGEWDPSSSNLFYVEMIDSDSLANGYAVGVNAKGSTDLVSLWTIRGGKIADLVAETSFDWSESDLAQVVVSREVSGKWKLTATDLSTGISSITTGFNNDFLELDQLGIKFNYSQSRSGQLWFDDLMILRENTPPGIREVRSLTNGAILVCFSEPLNTEILWQDNFKLKGKSGAEYDISSLQIVTGDTVILTPGEIIETDLFLSINAIEDVEGAFASVIDYAFEFKFPVSLRDVVFTEIMADPSPVVGLPEAEFLEIYNRSNHDVNFEGWKLLVKDQQYELPYFDIKSEAYAILCAQDDTALFSAFAIVMGVEQFPSLLNSGSRLALLAPDGVFIDELVYDDDWHHDYEKKNGGWTLEKIDTDRFCGNENNWTSSTDISGGSPGKVNSVEAPNEDNTAPEVIDSELLSANSFQIFFSETVTASTAGNKPNYSLDNTVEIDSVSFVANENNLVLWFSVSLEANKTYQLAVAGITDNCNNVIQTTTIPIFRQEIRANDVVINEVLFNPKSGGSDFVELYNRSGADIDLSTLRLATRNDTLGLKQVYELSLREIDFPNQSYLVFTKDSLDLGTNYWVSDPNLIITMTNFPTYPDDGGRVVLLNDSLEVIDEFAYSEEMHNPWLSDVEGVSLERLSVEGETNSSSNWHSASSLVGYATPGYENSQKEVENPVAVSVLITPDAISPNGDGYNDEMEISFQLDKPGYLANVFVFDINGRRVNRLLNNTLADTNGKIVFNGLSENGALLPMGIYILLTELVHSNGEKKVFKQAFLVTDRK
jgi:hypothetical protein